MRTRRHVAMQRFGPPEVMVWVEGPVRPRGDDEVLVAVEAIGVNFADTMVRRGEYRRDQSLDFTPGFEVAGRVLEAPDDGPAPGIDRARVHRDGRRLRGHGRRGARPRASALPTGCPRSTPRRCSRRASRRGTRSIATDASPQARASWCTPARAGSAACASSWLTEHGARTIATASTPEKLAVARKHGAAEALVSDPETLARAVREATGGRGADVVLDGVGGPLFAPSMRALAFGGRYVVVGSASQAPATLDVRALMPRGQTVCGFVVARVAEEDPAEPQRAFDEVQRRVLDGRLRPRVAVMGPGDIARAHELIESRALTGKIVLDLGSEH